MTVSQPNVTFKYRIKLRIPAFLVLHVRRLGYFLRFVSLWYNLRPVKVSQTRETLIAAGVVNVMYDVYLPSFFPICYLRATSRFPSLS